MLAERLGCPVWQESFGARAGFPQDHPQFAGHLPAGRGALRQALAGHDLVLVVGAPAFRQLSVRTGPFVEPGTRVVVVTVRSAEAHHSTADLAVIASITPLVAGVARSVPPRVNRHGRIPHPPRPRTHDRTLSPSKVFLSTGDTAAQGRHRGRGDTVESAATARHGSGSDPLGFLSAAMGGLGFALPAAAGLRMALPHRPS